MWPNQSRSTMLKVKDEVKPRVVKVQGSVKNCFHFAGQAAYSLPVHWILLFPIIVSKHWSHYVEFPLLFFRPINDCIYDVCPSVIRSKVVQEMTGCSSMIHRLSWACKFGWKLGKKLFWLRILDASRSCWAEIQWVQVFWGFCFGFLPDREMGQYENNYAARWR